MKCLINIKAMMDPVPGSVKVGPQGTKTGMCPACRTPGVMLSIVGSVIRAHTVAPREIPENDPQPGTSSAPKIKYGKGLTDHQAELTDSGLRVGSPVLSDKRRSAELDGAYERGTVKLPVKVKGEDGKERSKLIDHPATEENVRAALAYWKARRPRTAEARARQTDALTEMYRRLDGFRDGKEATQGNGMLDAASVHRGPTLVQGRDVPVRLRDPELPFTEPTDLRRDGSVRMMTTVDMPRGRDRFDSKITDVPEPPRKRTAAERRRYRRAHQSPK